MRQEIIKNICLQVKTPRIQAKQSCEVFGAIKMYVTSRLRGVTNVHTWGACVARLCLVFILIMCAPSGAHAATCTWTNGAATNFWNNSANWSCASVPADGDDVIINNGDTVTVDGVDPGDSGDIGVDNLIINNGSTLNLNGFDLGGAGHPVVLNLSGGGGGTLQITSDETAFATSLYTNSSNWSVDKESCTGTYEFIGDGNGVSNTYTIDNEVNFCNVIINDPNPNSDIFLFKFASGPFFWRDLNVIDGIYKGEATGTNVQYFYYGNIAIGSGGEFIDNGPVASGNFSNFNGNLVNNGGTFTHNNGLARFNAPYAHLNGEAPTTQYLTGDFNFYQVQLFDRAVTATPGQDGINQKLILTAGSTINIQNQLIIWGEDNDDRFELLTDTPGTEATIQMGAGASVIAMGTGRVTDVHLLDSNSDPWPGGVTGDITTGGNATGWFPNLSGNVSDTPGGTGIANLTVRLLINGVDSGIYDVTDSSGNFSLSNVTSAGDVITIYVDDETTNAVLVSKTDGSVLSGLQLYSNWLTVRSDGAQPALTATDLALADNGDINNAGDVPSSTDITEVYTVNGSSLNVPLGGLFVQSGSFTPGVDMDLGGTLDVDGTIDIAAHSVNLGGDFNVDNFATFTDLAGASITFDGTTTQSYYQGTSAINSDIVISNTSATVSLAGHLNIGANDLTIGPGATFFLNQYSIISATGAFSNDGTLQLTGEENINLTANDTDSGTWEFIDDGDNTAEVQPVGGASIPIHTFYNLVINNTASVPAQRDTYQSQNNGLIVNGDFTVKSGTFSTANFASDFNGDFVLETNGQFTAGSSAIAIAGDFLNGSGIGFVGGSSTATFDSDVDHTISGLTLFNNVAYSQTTDNSTSNTLTFDGGTTYIITGTLTLDGLDSNDKILIVSSTPGTAATINVTGGSGNVSADYLTVTDNNLQAGGSVMSPALDPANSVNGGNTTGWFTLASVEFSTTTANSTDESAADNFPTLRIKGTLVASNTVDVVISGGTATGGGTDYTLSSPVTITIPAGVYDGTSATEVAITAPALVQDVIVEGNETIIFSLSNFGSEITSGDADSDLTNESTHTYTITDDDGLVVQFSAATTSSPEAVGTVPNLVVSGAIITSPVTVEIAATGGTATGAGGDYTFATPVTQTIPVGDYSTATNIPITGLTINNDTNIETNETIDLLLQNPSANLSIGTQSTHTYTIIDDDSANVTISVTDGTVAENPSDNGEFTVTMSEINNTGSSITITYTVGGLATAGSDYAALTGTVDIPNGASSATITVDTTGFDDLLLEGGETVTVKLASTNNTDVTIGATNVATLLIVDDEDDDGDSVSAANENAGFNGGDGNGDGILDSIQSNVTNIPNLVTGGSTTVDITGSATCNVVSNVRGIAESSLGVQDTSYEYPAGLVQFLIECTSPGDTAHIDIYYDQNYNTSNWKLRKYNDKTSSYQNVDATSTVTIAPVTLVSGGQTVTRVSYQVTDGSILDTDANPAYTDRFIFDPVGPGVTPATTPATSSSGGGGGSSGVLPVAPKVVVAKPASIEPSKKLIDLIGGEEPNVPPEFSDYVCSRYLKSYIVLGRQNNPDEVTKLQEFLNVSEGEKLTVDGVYDTDDFNAVVRFQKKYADQILAPWKLSKASGVVGITTTAKINIMMCSTQKGCPYFSTYMKKGDKSLEVVKLQDFINIIFAPTSGYPTNGIPLSKKFDTKTFDGVKKFQNVYKEIVLKPWSLNSATGWFYQTSRHASNKLLNCDEGVTTLDNGNVIR